MKTDRQNAIALPSERFRLGEAVACDGHNDETLVVDGRSEISPAQAVEDKLSRMLRDASLPVSHLQMRNLLRPRWRA